MEKENIFAGSTSCECLASFLPFVLHWSALQMLWGPTRDSWLHLSMLLRAVSGVRLRSLREPRRSSSFSPLGRFRCS